jgi:hypothetical protein
MKKILTFEKFCGTCGCSIKKKTKKPKKVSEKLMIDDEEIENDDEILENAQYDKILSVMSDFKKGLDGIKKDLNDFKEDVKKGFINVNKRLGSVEDTLVNIVKLNDLKTK